MLCAAGEVLGFPDGTTRVTLTRLLRAEKIRRDERGRYLLAPSVDSFSHFLDAWRQGDRRTRVWKGDWLRVWYPRGTARLERVRALRALELLGLREGLEGVWVRPNNLVAPLSTVRRQLRDFGLVAEAKTFVASDFEDAKRWDSLWPLVKLEATYQRSLHDLRHSGQRLTRLPVEHAAAEVYRASAAAMHILAFDLLLPDDILPGETRRALTKEMLNYDKLGRSVWSQLIVVARRAA